MIKGLDISPINSNAWLAGFYDADANFSINICKRWNKSSIRVQLYYRLETAQTYKTKFNKINESLFDIMSKIASYLKVNLLTRTRCINNKEYYSFILMALNKTNINKIVNYFSEFQLLSSKRLDYNDWYFILKFKNKNKITSSYIEEALKIRKYFNKSRITFIWNHLENSYLES